MTVPHTEQGILARLAHPERDRNVITVSRHGRVKLDAYWPPENDAPLWRISVSASSGWMRPDELRWVRDQIQVLAEEERDA